MRINKPLFHLYFFIGFLLICLFWVLNRKVNGTDLTFCAIFSLVASLENKEEK